MFTIAKRAGEPVRVTIVEATAAEPAAVIVLAPIDAKMRRRALRAAQRFLKAMDVPEADGIEGELLLDVSDEVSRELMRLGVTALEGIVDDATGEPFELTPDLMTRLRTSDQADRPTGTIDDLLADERVFERLEAEYVMPDARRRLEKNGLSGSPNGTSTEAMPGSDTANSPAKRTRKAGAKSARIRKTRSTATKR